MVYAEIPYLSPDNPYVVKSAAAGTWSIEFVGLTLKDVKEMMEAQKLSVTDDKDIETLPATVINAVAATKPSTVIVGLPEFTNNPVVLKTAFNNRFDTIVIKDNGTELLPGAPLSEGEHILSIYRLVDGKPSDETTYSVTVDTIAPTVSYYKMDNTSKNRIVIAGECSSDAVEMYINGEAQYLGGEHNVFSNFWILKSGLNTYEIIIKDHAGNVCRDTISVQH